MTKNLIACRILEDAEVDLRTVMKSLTAAQPEQLETARRLLERMSASLGEIEAAARRDSSLPIKNNLIGFRKSLGQASSLATKALTTLDRQAKLAGLVPSDSASKLYVEG